MPTGLFFPMQPALLPNRQRLPRIDQAGTLDNEMPGEKYPPLLADPARTETDSYWLRAKLRRTPLHKVRITVLEGKGGGLTG